ncbi:MAG: hemerythrin family protein [Deltaproteobacteria bacterium]|nr:hemerythrin family protein [Deltaproteobacteria bacterium]
MALFEWTEKISVGVKVFDDQHKKLIGYINELHEAMKNRQGKEVLEKIFIDLENYTKTHFNHEITVLKAEKYPDLDEHLRQHHKLVEQLVELKDKHAAGKLFVSSQTMEFLKKWLTDHIMGHDKKYSGFLDSKNIQ